MTARAIFRFAGPDKSQLACISNRDTWAAESRNDFIAANGGTEAGVWLWDANPYVPKPLGDFPQLEAALAKAWEYLVMEWPIREWIATHRPKTFSRTKRRGWATLQTLMDESLPFISPKRRTFSRHGAIRCTICRRRTSVPIEGA